ncbi:dihydrofolate reductase [Fructilactobacillus sp. Tb1]|uniref:dihydrofolate reductase n=1 Tax=Fructilactobacillus sp. Tb1 TaxID=3422304 RepID=UPI003D2B343E
MLAFIWAESANRVIGKDGHLPWHIADDMQFFKKTTLNHQVVCGYTTFESFGGRPLLKRKNLVITHRNASQFPENVTIFNSKDEFLQYANKFQDELIFVIGGRAIYQELLPYTEYLYRTKIDVDVEGDTKMIDIDYSDFILMEEIPGEKNEEFPHQFEIYQRKIKREG